MPHISKFEYEYCARAKERTPGALLSTIVSGITQKPREKAKTLSSYNLNNSAVKVTNTESPACAAIAFTAIFAKIPCFQAAYFSRNPSSSGPRWFGMVWPWAEAFLRLSARQPGAVA
jgi:hypothetical protein